MPSSDCVIRPAIREDAGLILGMIRELAEYERLLHEVEATEESLEQALFSESPCAEALIGEWNGEANGFALFFRNFSTFLGRPGLYLEDLYVRPAARGKGLGKALLLHLAGLAEARGYGRMEWSVLDWNHPAIDFYESLGANVLREWLPVRVTRSGIAQLVGISYGLGGEVSSFTEKKSANTC